MDTSVSEVVRGPNLRHSRYRGLAKNHLQNVFSAMAINIGRLGAHYDAKPTTQRRPTRIRELYLTTGLEGA